MSSVLIAQSVPEMRKLMAELVRLSGNEPLPAGSIIEAMKICKVEEPHVIVTDSELQDGNGNELLRDLREAGVSGLAIVVTDRWGVDPATYDWQELRILDVVAKPFTPRDFMAKIRTAVELTSNSGRLVTFLDAIISRNTRALAAV